MSSRLSRAVRIALRCVAAAVAVATTGIAAARPAPVELRIQAQPLDAALRELSSLTDTNILFSPEAVQGVRSDAVVARLTAEEAALALVAGTDLEVVRDLVGALIVRPRRVWFSRDPLEEVIVVGVRRSLESSQDIKRESDTFVDSVTATDIGAFPDKSVAEALQRVPGITVSRLQSNDDSTHFSAEPAAVLIRGLTFVRTELNGRDSFSADGYRGLNFNDISPELMAGVDVYKNQTAEMVEGGIAGTVNLRTRLPLDPPDRVFSFTGRANYGDRSDDTTYEGSSVYSDSWQTDFGRFGAMANLAYSHIKTQTEGVIMQRIGAFCSDGYGDASGAAIVGGGRIDSVHGDALRRIQLAVSAEPGELLRSALRPGTPRLIGSTAVRKQRQARAGEPAVHGFAVRQCVAGAQLERFAVRIVGDTGARAADECVHRARGWHVRVHVRHPTACSDPAC